MFVRSAAESTLRCSFLLVKRERGAIVFLLLCRPSSHPRPTHSHKKLMGSLSFWPFPPLPFLLGEKVGNCVGAEVKSVLHTTPSLASHSPQKNSSSAHVFSFICTVIRLRLLSCLDLLRGTNRQTNVRVSCF